MKAIFVESTGFSGIVSYHLGDRDYARLQRLLMAQPNAGDVMPGCGGLRKVRISDPGRGKGKRGGIRVIYLHVPVANWFYMLDLYGKDEKDDLAPEEKKHLRVLAESLKNQALVKFLAQKGKKKS